ncbi:hypothetical protein EDD30_7288 [Couchioplanes caeruleus]|uniref:Uncharacterized protein n=2 Tax=Couchioplanes caeruleus TaxID=56438 RepID=A0A1K0FPJ0_9ACTN|nr:hypothetical protein BG844_08845 [Couchioplanes caeruleus subsp. caeruleus]ROP34210.1 hypothetical protein EDD30_7288 [Couchioplanes caeruleus]
MHRAAHRTDSPTHPWAVERDTPPPQHDRKRDGIDSLTAAYFTVRLDALAARPLYLDRLEHTLGMRQVALRIEGFRYEFTATRTPRAFPHRGRSCPDVPSLRGSAEHLRQRRSGHPLREQRGG